MKNSLFINGGEVLSIEDNKYLVLDEEYDIMKIVSKEEFKKELNKYANVCRSSWNKKLYQDWLKLRELVK